MYKAFRAELDQANYLAAEIHRQKKLHSLVDMAIVCRFKNQVQRLQTMLAGKGIASNQFTDKDVRFESDSVKLITLHSIKGLQMKRGQVCTLDRPPWGSCKKLHELIICFSLRTNFTTIYFQNKNIMEGALANELRIDRF